MLVIKRKVDEVVTIVPVDGPGGSRAANELLCEGAIQITLLAVGSNWVKLAIDAPQSLKIWRGQGPVTNHLALADSLNASAKSVELSKN
jgi:sRNA-binding carbon storage regulator CsrA